MYKFKIGDRVHYVVYPSRSVDVSVTGTVVAVDAVKGKPTLYRVQWDDVDYTRPTVIGGVYSKYPPVPATYHSGDLASVAVAVSV